MAMSPGNDNGRKANKPTRPPRGLERPGTETGLDASGISAITSFALSLSIICILAGGLTSFHVGFCTVGGAAIGLGWPLCCLFSLIVTRRARLLAPRRVFSDQVIRRS